MLCAVLDRWYFFALNYQNCWCQMLTIRYDECWSTFVPMLLSIAWTLSQRSLRRCYEFPFCWLLCAAKLYSALVCRYVRVNLSLRLYLSPDCDALSMCHCRLRVCVRASVSPCPNATLQHWIPTYRTNAQLFRSILFFFSIFFFGEYLQRNWFLFHWNINLSFFVFIQLHPIDCRISLFISKKRISGLTL